jgi:hypothetical protein
MLERGVPQRGERRRLGSSSMCHREARTDPVAADEPTAHYRRQTYRTRLGSSHSAPDYGAEPRRKVHVGPSIYLQEVVFVVGALVIATGVSLMALVLAGAL